MSENDVVVSPISMHRFSNLISSTNQRKKMSHPSLSATLRVTSSLFSWTGIALGFFQFSSFSFITMSQCYMWQCIVNNFHNLLSHVNTFVYTFWDKQMQNIAKFWDKLLYSLAEYNGEFPMITQ